MRGMGQWEGEAGREKGAGEREMRPLQSWIRSEVSDLESVGGLKVCVHAEASVYCSTESRV